MGSLTERKPVKVNIIRMPYYRLNEALKTWKPLHIVVHPDDSVCSQPKTCHMPHKLVVAFYKLKRIERKGDLKSFIHRYCPTQTDCKNCEVAPACPKEGLK